MGHRNPTLFWGAAAPTTSVGCSPNVSQPMRKSKRSRWLVDGGNSVSLTNTPAAPYRFGRVISLLRTDRATFACTRFQKSLPTASTFSQKTVSVTSSRARSIFRQVSLIFGSRFKSAIFDSEWTLRNHASWCIALWWITNFRSLFLQV